MKIGYHKDNAGKIILSEEEEARLKLIKVRKKSFSRYRTFCFSCYGTLHNSQYCLGSKVVKYCYPCALKMLDRMIETSGRLQKRVKLIKKDLLEKEDEITKNDVVSKLANE